MTIEAFVNILKKIDPDISRYQRIRKKSDDAYSVWSDYGTRTLYANGVPVGSVKKFRSIISPSKKMTLLLHVTFTHFP